MQSCSAAAMSLFALKMMDRLWPYMPTPTLTFGSQWWLTNRVQFPYSLAAGDCVSPHVLSFHLPYLVVCVQSPGAPEIRG